MKEIEELRLGLETAYIDGNVASNLMYKPQFVSNNYKEGKKVLSSIEDELLMCDQFQISVAFITLGGIEPLLQTLKELEKKHISGEILKTNYRSRGRTCTSYFRDGGTWYICDRWKKPRIYKGFGSLVLDVSV